MSNKIESGTSYEDIVTYCSIHEEVEIHFKNKEYAKRLVFTKEEFLLLFASIQRVFVESGIDWDSMLKKMNPNHVVHHSKRSKKKRDNKEQLKLF